MELMWGSNHWFCWLFVTLHQLPNLVCHTEERFTPQQIRYVYRNKCKESEAVYPIFLQRGTNPATMGKKNYDTISNISCPGRRMSKKWNQRLYRKYAKSLHFPYSVTVSMTACLWISCLSTVYSKAICRFIVYNDTKFKYTHRSLVFW